MSTSSIFAYAAELRKQMLEEYRLVQEDEYARALHATNGYMTRDGKDSWDVFFGPPNVFEKWATDELKEHGRPTTRTAFEREWLNNYLGGSND
jgi:hypothetical protein